jgi:ligand-binding sensor domain-containing protein
MRRACLLFAFPPAEAQTQKGEFLDAGSAIAVSKVLRRHRGRFSLTSMGFALLALSPHATLAAEPTLARAEVIEQSAVIPVVDANDIVFSRLAANSGLSQARVSHIVQDNQGFMWFGTQYGLNRYDGYKFKVFAHDPLRPNSLGGVYIKSLFKDHAGRLWIGCDQRLDRFDPITETFVHYSFRAEAQSGDVTVNGISEDASGMLWLATESGLFSFDPATGRSRNFRHDDKDPTTLSSDSIKFAGEDREDAFWVASGAGLEAFDRAAGQVTQRVPLPEMRELSFFEDRNGTFWIFHASGSGLATFNRKSRTLTHYTFDDHGKFKGPHLAIFSMIEDRNGVLWFGTAGSGLIKMDREQNRFIRYRNYANDPQSLATDNLVALFEDRDGNIWTALHGMRVNVFSSHALPFQKLAYGPTPLETEGGTMVNAVYEAAGDGLWLSYLGDLSRVNRSSGSRESFPAATQGTSADVITVLEDAHGATWFGTSGGGLAQLNHDGKWRYFRHDAHDPTSLSNDVVTRLLIDHNGTLWAVTWNGLDRFDATTGHFQTYNADGGSGSRAYLSMAEDASGLFWLGTSYSGVEKFDPSTGRFTRYVHDESDPASLSNNRVNAVFVDHVGGVWMGTQNGLGSLDRDTGQFTAYYESNGLGGNVVSCILEDQSGNLWMSTNHGISRYNPKAKQFDNYSVGDGLPGPDLSGWGSCFKSKRGEMFFGGYAGATAFFPDKMLETTGKPTVVFTEFDLAGLPVNIGGASPLSKAIGYTEEVTLSHQDNNFAVEFTALPSRSAESNRYRYRLNGLDKSWHEVASDRRLASFTTLPAGRYRLLVQGATSRGPWSEATELRIRILKPWWDTWWFRSAIFTALLIVLCIVYYVRLEQLRKRIREGLELRHAERERIARDLHDTLLQGIQALLFRLQAWGKHSAIPLQQRNEISTVATQARAIVVEGRDRILELRRTNIAQAELIEALKAVASAEESGSSAAFSITVKGEERALIPEAYEQLLEITREAIRNAYRHSGAANISVMIEYQSTRLQIAIVDDGRGIVDSMVSAAQHEGHFGLLGMRERAAQLRATLIIGKGAKKGASVVLSVPANTVYVEAQNPRRQRRSL